MHSDEACQGSCCGSSSLSAALMWQMMPSAAPTRLPQGTALPHTAACLQTAWRLSSYVAISYCNASSIASWKCSRCDGISAGFEPEEVGASVGGLVRVAVWMGCLWWLSGWDASSVGSWLAMLARLAGAGWLAC